MRRVNSHLPGSLNESTQRIAFEPNEETIRTRARHPGTKYLKIAWPSGAPEVPMAEDGFSATSNLAVMTLKDSHRGWLIYVFSITPAKPTEFVMLRIADRFQRLAENHNRR